MSLSKKVVQAKKRSQMRLPTIEKSTLDRMEISLTDTEFRLKTTKLMLLSSFLQILTVADHPTTVMSLNLTFQLKKNRNNDYNPQEL